MRLLMTALLMGGLAASLDAQGSTTIDPGMTRDQVVAKLGEPLSTRDYQGHTYLLYKNGCEKTCGMNDLVVLDSGKVTDAVFRAAGRRYSGTSSSPRMISMAEAKHANVGGPLAVPAGEPAATKVPAKPVKAAPAPKKAEVSATPKKTAVSAVPKKTETASVKSVTPAPAPAPAPKTEAAASTKKPAAAPPAKKDSTKKPPAGHEP